ncbi:sodium:proton antiporter [Aestuariicella hydrocarbonica]|uniref:Sodium:proton antiporter n=1 Tax=Pseudomaricurvus hydrocarbonicus TaxID=1470433 RepID=A0A9E5MPE7_9GAMM|nr:sodium:proton antiporter NhaD [Aestuariicella hydrocarbonica]NHO68006.1 sodium:proton antiporter [Aestuariicella hydrocarbonica]
MFEAFLIFLAVLALLCIVFEEVIHINKAKTALFLGCLSWLCLFVQAGGAEGQEEINEHLNENLLEIATLWLFLMSTMTFVAYLNAKGMIQNMVRRVFPSEVSTRVLLFQVAFFALFLSAICDNVTATLVSLGLVQAFNLETRAKLKMAALVVFAVNSGGVALITGDVTTLMIFLGGYVSMSQLLLLLLPSALGVIALAILFSINLPGKIKLEPVKGTFRTQDVVIAVVFFSTILSTMLFNVFFGVPPVLTFLTGLSVMFLVGTLSHTNKEEIKILEYIRQVEYDTLLFFLGILLLVGMLKEVGVLETLAHFYAQFEPHYANYVAGAVSALLDNVPLTAALLKAGPDLLTSEWLALTYAVGVGGSLLAIGSAAGILAMSKVKELTFGSYLRFVPALTVAYSVGYVATIWVAAAAGIQ